jgi:hypothetical protein
VGACLCGSDACLLHQKLILAKLRHFCWAQLYITGAGIMAISFNLSSEQSENARRFIAYSLIPTNIHFIMSYLIHAYVNK